jgi:hypothetical protein
LSVVDERKYKTIWWFTLLHELGKVKQ